MLSRRALLLAGVAAVAGCERSPHVPVARASIPSTALGAQIRGRFTDQRRARFELLSAASGVAVRAGELGADLYRIGTPAGSGLRPVTASVPGQVAADALVRAVLRPTAGLGPDTVDVRLRSGVQWDVVLRAGAGDLHLDLADARLAAVTVLGATGSVRLWLPRPVRAVVVLLGPHVGEAEIFAPADVPVSAAPPPGPGYLLRSAAARLTVHR